MELFIKPFARNQENGLLSRRLDLKRKFLEYKILSLMFVFMGSHLYHGFS